ncbi:hypothetical protein J4477_04970 [Candidatus Pacearchaeota archaeon]|nr:hypothetical protein [Candidatus Pacearchaeota archaeon]
MVKTPDKCHVCHDYFNDGDIVCEITHPAQPLVALCHVVPYGIPYGKDILSDPDMREFFAGEGDILFERNMSDLTSDNPRDCSIEMLFHKHIGQPNAALLKRASDHIFYKGEVYPLSDIPKKGGSNHFEIALNGGRGARIEGNLKFLPYFFTY